MPFHRYTWLAIAILQLQSGLGVAQDINLYPPDTDNLDPSVDLNSYGNNSLYTRWRPSSHFIAPGGHLNDPCGPMYDDKAGVYHLFYQHFPQHVNFGNKSWSHAISSDSMMTWQDVTDWENRSMVAVQPGAYPEYDWIGVFSGGAQPVGLTGQKDGNLTLMYTGAMKWPDNWRKPYQVGTETQNIATSSDGGKTWQKYPGNPIITDAPGGWDVTGWRDPVFSLEPNFDALLGYKEPHYYMVFGSGIRGVGPRVPLYTAKATDLTKWEFLGALFETAADTSFGGDPTVTGTFAYNFEMANIFFLTEETENGGEGTTQHFVLTMCSEGFGNERHPLDHYALFAMGTVQKRQNESIEMTIQASGYSDWGNLYATNTFDDTKHHRRVLWGHSEDELGDQAIGAVAQGFQGAMGLAREIYIRRTRGVVPDGDIKDANHIWIAEPDTQPPSYSVIIFSQRPVNDVVHGLHQGARGTEFGTRLVSSVAPLDGIQSSKFHIHFEVPLIPTQGSIGARLRSTPSNEEYADVVFYPSNSTILFDRSHSSLLPSVNRTTYVGHFRPFTFADGKQEPLSVDIFVDGSLVEIFVNERFAMTARIYPSRADATGVALFAIDEKGAEGAQVQFTNIKVWEGLSNAWPERPVNASSPLVYDKEYERIVTFDNPFVEKGTQLYVGN